MLLNDFELYILLLLYINIVLYIYIFIELVGYKIFNIYEWVIFTNRLINFSFLILTDFYSIRLSHMK